MPIPMPRRSDPVPIIRRSYIYRPSRSLFDSSKAFKEGRVIYLSDFRVTKECVKFSPIFYGKNLTIFLNCYF